MEETRRAHPKIDVRKIYHARQGYAEQMPRASGTEGFRGWASGASYTAVARS